MAHHRRIANEAQAGIERGERNPSVKQLAKIAALDVPIGMLFDVSEVELHNGDISLE